MHDMLYVQNLLSAVEKKAQENNAKKVTRIKVVVGRDSGLDPLHFKEDLDVFKTNTIANDAVVEMGVGEGDEIILRDVELEV